MKYKIKIYRIQITNLKVELNYNYKLYPFDPGSVL